MVSAYGPLVMKVLLPLRMYSSPSRRAVDVSEDGVFSYEEVSLIVHGKLSEHLSHTDSNTLYKIGDA